MEFIKCEMDINSDKQKDIPLTEISVAYANEASCCHSPDTAYTPFSSYPASPCFPFFSTIVLNCISEHEVQTKYRPGGGGGGLQLSVLHL